MSFIPTLVVATWNHIEVTERFLKSLRDCSKEKWRLIVVDNGSHDATANFVEGFDPGPQFKLQVIRNSENLGCAKAWNQGIRAALEAKAPLIGILNNDLVFVPEWDRNLLQFWKKDPLAHRAFAPHPVNWALDELTRRAEKFMQRNATRTRQRMRSEAMFFAAEVFGEAGLYDEDYFVSYEDFDYFLRLDKLGIHPLETGASVVWHEEKSSRQDLPNHEREGREIFVSKWGAALLRHPGFEIPRSTRRWWRWRERVGLL